LDTSSLDPTLNHLVIQIDGLVVRGLVPGAYMLAVFEQA
jgi:hypothetical protein